MRAFAASLLALGLVAAIPLLRERASRYGEIGPSESMPTPIAAAIPLGSPGPAPPLPTVPAPTAGASTGATATQTAQPGTATPTDPPPQFGTGAANTQRLPGGAARPDTPRQLLGAAASARTGELQVVIDYGGGARSAVRVRFDRGDDRATSRLHLTTTYTSASSGGTRTVEQVAIGERSWERRGDGPWLAVSARDGLWDQLATYFPPADGVESPVSDTSGDGMVIRYKDTIRNAEAELILDAAGAPRSLVQRLGGGGVQVQVLYDQLDRPVTIEVPMLP